MMDPIILGVLIVGVLALVFAGYKAYRIMQLDAGTPKMREISEAVRQGAMAFLNREYAILVVFILVVAIVLWYVVKSPPMAIAFVVGAFLSALTGNIGMRIATKANARTAEAAKQSINNGLQVAFSSGAVMGLCVVALGLLGVTSFYLIYGDPNLIFGFSFGASSIALFARVGGGIYTKAADVGADLVGKIEAGIPEDDPRNPAVIADNVGDNVGDVAGMGADLFESYVGSIIATMVIGLSVTAFSKAAATVLPLVLAAIGIIASILGVLMVRTGKKADAQAAMNKGVWGSAVIMALASYFVIRWMGAPVGVFYATTSGLVAGIIIGLATQYYTSNDFKPAQKIAEASKTGAATNLIQGIATGMLSTVIPVLAVGAGIWVAYYYNGVYGIAIAAVGMLSTLGITLATDTYGPVADNAAGIAEMAGMGKEVRRRAESLDAVGNTTAAMGKGFAIGSAALTALAFFVSYQQVAKLSSIDLTHANVIIGLFIGGLMPFLFSAFAMKAVGKAAYQMVNEVRRQFKQIKGLMEGKAKPDYKRCVSISTGAALREMIIPSLLAIAIPIGVGFWSVEALGGLLAGALVTGFLLAVFMANAGGAWDNAKKYIEAGHFGGKGSDPHKAAVVGDTVGDPFKDTAGPSLNILIKLMSIVALVFVPLFL